VTQLNKLAAKEEVTMSIVVHSIYVILLSKICNQEDIVVGTTIAGRRHAELEHIIGMFVNILPLRNYPAGGKTFKEFLAEVKKRILKALENQEYQFEDLVNKMAANRDISRSPLFDAAFGFQNMEVPTLEIPGVKVTPYKYQESLARYDISLVAEEVDDKLRFTFEYRTSLFKKETILNYIGYFKEILLAVIENKETLLKDIHISHGLLAPKINVPEIRLRF
jgi:non-ribosomal peptide synthetase component F